MALALARRRAVANHQERLRRLALDEELILVLAALADGDDY